MRARWPHIRLRLAMEEVAVFLIFSASYCTQLTETVANLPALQSGNEYSGPSDATQGTDACKCNTVSYSLISACAGCQGGEWIPYSLFVTNCSASYSNFTKGQFVPGVDIPVGTAFPAWAYDTLNSNSFNNATAYDIFLHNTTEFTHSGTSNTNSTASPSPVPHSKSHAGAIAGGVVGGIVGLALLAGLVAFFLIRRRRDARSNITEKQHIGGAHGPMSPTTTEPKSPRRYYDPSDPTTFPDAMFNGNRTIGGSSVAMSSPAPGSTTNVTSNGHHAGMPSWGSSEIGSTDKGHYHSGLPEV